MTKERFIKVEVKSPVKSLLLMAGMHRGGTSAVAGAIAALGATLPKRLLDAVSSNTRGQFEPLVIAKTHDEILEKIGSRWYDWLPIDPEFFCSNLAQYYAEQLKCHVEEDFGTAPLILLKDPRVCRLIPLWERVADMSSFELRVILPYRNPYDVAASINERDGISLHESLLCWLRNILDAERATRYLPRSFVRHESFLRDWRPEISRIEHQIDVKFPRQRLEAAVKIDQFLLSGLKNFITTFEMPKTESSLQRWLSDAVLSMDVLVSSPYDIAATDKLNEIFQEFSLVTSTVGPAFVGQQLRCNDVSAPRNANAEGMAVVREEIEQQSLTASLALTDGGARRVEHEVACKAAQLLQEEQRTSLLTVENHVRGLEEAYEVQISRNASLEDQIRILSKENNKLMLRRDELGEAVTNLAHHKAELEAALKNAREDCKNYKKDNLLLQADVAVLSERCAKHDSVNLTISNTVAKLEEENNKLVARRNELGAIVAGLTEENDKLTAAHGQMLKRTNKLAKSIDFFGRNNSDKRTGQTNVRLSAFAVWSDRKAKLRFETVIRDLSHTPLFDREWYLSRYKDVREAEVDPVRHYVTSGFMEGRYPHPLFDTRYYLEEYPDVCYSGINPLFHYLRNGSAESRNPNLFFDTKWYRERHMSGISNLDPIIDYWNTWENGPKDPGPMFSSRDYISTHPKPRIGISNPLARHLHNLP